MLKDTVYSTFDLMTLKSKGIIYGAWLSMIPRNVNLGENKFEINKQTRLF